MGPTDSTTTECDICEPDTSGKLARKTLVTHSNKRKPVSIQCRLASLVAVCVLPVWIAAGFLCYLDYQSRRAVTEQRMLETARALKLVVDRDLAGMQASLNDLATSNALVENDLLAAHHRAQAILKTQPDADIILSDASGQELFNTFCPYGMPLPKRGSIDPVRKVFETGRPVIANVYKGAATERLRISVDVPVFRNGKVVYDLAMAVPPERFGAVLQQQHLPKEWVGKIFDSNQIMVARTRLENEFIGRKPGSTFGKRMMDTTEGTIEVVNFEGVRMFNSFSRSASSGWTVAIGVPRANMMAEIWRWLAWTIFGTAVLSGIGIGLALIMARRIADSIQALIEPALALGRGESIVIGQLELTESNKVAESLVKASQLIQQRTSERERAEAAHREAEDLKELNKELKRSETEARARASELAAIMDAVPAATFIAHDPRCHEMTSNKAAYKLLRLAEGGNASMSAPLSERPSHLKYARDGRELSVDELPVQVAAATGREVRDCEIEIVYEDGSSRSIFGNAVPLLNEAGSVRGAVGAFVDISERKLAEKALRQSEERFRLVVEGSPIGMYIQTDGIYRYLNAAALSMFGAHDAQSFIGQRFMDRVHPDSRTAVAERARSVLEEKRIAPFLDEKFIRLDGTPFDVEVTALPFVFEEREGGLVFFSDISARKLDEAKRRALEQQLRQAQKMEAMGRLAGGIAHDFNNILMVIQSYTEMLQEEDLPSRITLQRNTREIMKAAERATSLTGQMLAFSRKQIISPIVLDLNDAIHETAKMLQRLIGEDIELRTEPADALWAIEADSHQIVQVLMNLCVNARDAMPQGGTITIATENVTVNEGSIRVHPAGDYVRLSVTDTGNGMSKEIQEHIFDPFFTTKEVGRGTGLGLATVYGIVKQNGGHVWADSEPGRGATFIICLPRVKADLTANISGKAEARPRGTETLLIVEDEEALQDAMCDYLRILGYTVFAASSGPEALSIVSKIEDLDLLITDVVMPRMSGRELSQKVASLRPKLKTIYMSGYADDAVLRHGIHEFGAAFLQKPFSLGTLARKLRETLDQTESLQ